MIRLGISIVGVAVQGLLWATASRRLGSFGSKDLWTASGLIAVMPYGALVGFLNIGGFLELPVSFLATALIIAGVAWTGISAFAALKRPL